MHYLNFILTQIHIWGPLIYAFIFFVAIFESFVLTGILVPGTIIVLIIGFLASQGVLNFFLLLIFTSFGAAIGDTLSFYLGLKHGRKIAAKMRHNFKTDYIGIGERFFKKHGSKSVFIGRFVAMIRPFVPFIAGFLDMNVEQFMIWNISSAILWSGLYLTLGFFFGRALHTIIFWASRVGFILLFIIIFAIISYMVKIKIENGKKKM